MLKQKAQKLSTFIPKNMIAANAVVFVGLIFFISLYLLQINTTTQLGLQIKDIETNLIEAQEVSRDLQVDVAEYQSITNLQERIQDMELAQVVDVSYVSVAVPVTAVAKR